ncbi:MAG: phosphoglycerate kinase [Rickettsiales bacterium]|nr:phosphoglycerate kinase [Rickettsiales bacterium]
MLAIDDMKNLAGKCVLVRDDFNVQIVNGRITDEFRIEQSLPTLRRLIGAGARVAVMAHLGRPNGRDAGLSLAPVARALERLLGRPVVFVPDCLDRGFIGAMECGGVALLENLRYYREEEADDADFARRLAQGFDYYVNDAFAVSHRAHASVDAVTRFLPSFAGELLRREVGRLGSLMQNPKRPLLGIIAGAKVKSKVGVIKALARLCDKLIIGGGLGTSFCIAVGAENIAEPLWDESMRAAILDIMKEFGDKIILPVDKGTSKERTPGAAHRADKDRAALEPDDLVLDAGPKSIMEFEAAVDESKMLVWNGTLGLAEWGPLWGRGTFDLARHVAERSAAGRLESLVGGGDTVAALEAAGVKGKMTYVSTGGGAFLEFIEGASLPGLAALEL